MTKYILLILLVIVLCGCKTTEYIPVAGETVIKEQIQYVPVVNPADSATLEALLECSEDGEVLLKWFNASESEKTELEVQLDSLGRLLATMRIPENTLKVPVKISTTEKLVPYKVEVEKDLSWLDYCKIGAPFLILGLIVGRFMKAF